MKHYQSHKVVQAAKISDVVGFLVDGVQLVFDDGERVMKDATWSLRFEPQPGQYYVVYDDGYASISPAKAFEDGYAPIANATFTQPKITGYRQLSQVEADLMNEIKQKGVELGDLVFRLRTFTGQPREDGGDPGTKLDQRWISIGATDLQTGLMALTRGVAQPTTF